YAVDGRLAPQTLAGVLVAVSPSLFFQIVGAVGTLIGIVWGVIQIYSWFVRGRLTATVHCSRYSTDPAFLTGIFEAAAEQGLKGEPQAIKKKLLDFLEEHVIDRESNLVYFGQPRAFYDVKIHNRGNTTLQNVRLQAPMAMLIESARIIRANGKDDVV